ncbi:MAG: DNA-3-methyladenine glycosylase 2 family protein [Actinobacteria bacterium]|nr:DNA-3-methyladenine glycosylase 2 family protein [Actinomycetota bacterium]
MPTRTFPLPHPVDLLVTLRPLVVGGDTTIRLSPAAAVRAWRTPAGAATLEVRVTGDVATAEAWGPGASWALDQAPAFIGAEDDMAGFDPAHPLVRRAHRRRPGLRIARTGTIADVLLPTILQQKVTSLEAVRSWMRMVTRWGEPAPGPFAGLRLAPPPERFAATPTYDFHVLGVERKRAVTLIEASRRIRRLEEAATMSPEDAFTRLTALPGIGPWTANLVLRTACGDADRVEVGDFHVPNLVAWNLAGEPRGTDARMLELLAPFAGHRGRVVRLLALEGQRAPAWGPRMTVHAVERL